MDIRIVLHGVLFSLAFHNADFLLCQAVELVNHLVNLIFSHANACLWGLFFDRKDFVYSFLKLQNK